MTYKGWLRLAIGFGTFALIGSALGLGVSYGLPDYAMSKNDLRMVYGAKNTNAWYRFDGSFSYGGITSGQNGNDTLHTPYVPMLVRVGARGEDVKVIDETQPVDDQFNLNLVDSPNTFAEFYKLELAEKVIVYQKNQVLEFTNDEYLNPNDKSINSPKFFDALKSADVQKIDFVIRQNIPWVDNQGQKKLNLDGEPYYLQAKDWLYGVYRTAMTNNQNRDTPVTESNPFGGYGLLPSNANLEEWSARWKQLSQIAGQIGFYNGFSSPKGGFSNDYLYDMFNVKNLGELVKSSSGAFSNPSILGTYQGKQTVSIGAKNNGTSENFYQYFKHLLVSSLDLIPAPSDYIDDYASKIDVVTGQGRTLVIPNVSDPDIVSTEINIRKFAIFTYGTNFTNTLYAAPYYVAQNNQFQTKFLLNPHYWDQEFVKRDDIVKSLTLDYSPQQDNKIFAQSTFEQYRHGKIFKLPLDDLANDKILEIRKNPQKYGLHFKKSYNNSNFSGQLFPLLLPAHNAEKYHFNNNFAKIWFGSSIDEIKEGKMKIEQYHNPFSIAIRSQINAAINWYTQNRTMSTLDQTEPWYSYLPPDVEINASDSDQKSKTFYDYKEEINTIDYYDVDNQGRLTKHQITLEENKNHYDQNSTLEESIKSAHFNQIQPMVKKTLDLLLGQEADQNVEFVFTNRYPNATANHLQMLEQFAKIASTLDSRLKPKLEIYNSLNLLQSYLLGKGTWYTFHGWGPDYEGVGTWVTGHARERFSIHATAISIAQQPNLKEIMPNLFGYGQSLVESIDQVLKDYFKNDSHLLDVYYSPKNLNQVTNHQDTILSSSEIVGNALLDRQKYQNLNAQDKAKIDAARLYFNKTIAQIDFNNQKNFSEQFYVDFFREYMSVIGIYWGVDEIGVQNRQKPIPVVYQPWLTMSFNSKLIGYISDYRVDKLKENWW